ncbi:putative sensory transducer protein YfmS [compost metagenome]
MNKLEALIEAVPYMKKMNKDDIMIGITDRETFLFYAPSSDIDFGIKPGDRISLEDQNFIDALNGKFAINSVPPELYGFAISAYVIPVTDDDGTVIGTLAVAHSIENEEIFKAKAITLNEITNKLLEMVQTVAAHSEELSATSEHVLTNTKLAVDNSKNMNETIGFISEISNQTNLLGLNAAIEAARVGEAGAGFGIVAKEVRKLSVDTKNAAVHISQTLNAVQSSIHQLETDFSQIAASSQEQAVLVTEFMTIIEQLNESNNEIKVFVEKLLNHSNLNH